MKLPLICHQCIQDASDGNPIPAGGTEVPMKNVPVQASGIYRGKCVNGHNVTMIADFQPFELLFESAVEAMADGYMREAVGSFAASLERFYEFSTKILLLSTGVRAEQFEVIWQQVSSQSERQLGLYLGIYSSQFLEVPTLLKKRSTELRNQVVHKGLFPSPEAALGFGEDVYHIINIGIDRLRSTVPDVMETVRQDARNMMFRGVKSDESPICFSGPTTISLSILNEPMPLEEALRIAQVRLQNQRIATHRFGDA